MPRATASPGSRTTAARWPRPGSNGVYFLAQQGPNASGTGIVSAASYAPSGVNGISPGEMLTIFGQGLGPAQLTTLQLDSAGNVSALLAGTHVLFDNTPAPIVYTSSGQISVIAPYDIASKTTVTIRMQYQGVSSLPIEVPAIAANPTLFTLDGSGKGDAAVVRPDGSVINAAKPAAGEIVLLFAEGYGVSTPALPDGAIVAGTLSVPTVTPVLIDGQPVDTLYCGTAPSLVNGILQVNFRMPQLTAGSHQIQLQAGNRKSPAGVILQTR